MATNEAASFALRAIRRGERDVAGALAARFGYSRQAANAHLRKLERRGLIRGEGRTRSRTYALLKRTAMRFYSPSSSLEEHVIWEEFVRPLLDLCGEAALEICQYGFTEMVNNAIEHSEGTYVACFVVQDAVTVELVVRDDGVGIFRKIKEVFGLEDERQAILDLSKGKLTTDPERHTGEGIYFTSRVFDEFTIISGRLRFSHFPDESDWLVEVDDWVLVGQDGARPDPSLGNGGEHEATRSGTMVTMAIDTDTNRSLKDVFDQHAGDNYGFTVTHVPVGLGRRGDESLISRSQARRVLSRIERFERVILDFAGVTRIGQAFADEVFRVFPRQHPNVDVQWINADKDVEKMIRRVRAHLHDSQVR